MNLCEIKRFVWSSLKFPAKLRLIAQISFFHKNKNGNKNIERTKGKDPKDNSQNKYYCKR
jgi:hypothetical protein